jgi:hypothetical protein
MVSIPTVLTGFLRHLYGGALSDRGMIVHLIAPMGVGAIAGGLLASAASSALRAETQISISADGELCFASQQNKPRNVRFGS